MARRFDDEERRTFLLGVGLDNKDGHVRLTRGDHFHLVGGSEETHREMQDKIMELSDTLAKDGREIKDIGPDDIDHLTRLFKT